MIKWVQLRYAFAIASFFLVADNFRISAANIDDFDKARTLYNKGEIQSAAQLLSRLAISTRKNDPNCHYYLANTLLRLGKLSEARSEYRQVLLLRPSPQLANYCNKVLSDHLPNGPAQLSNDEGTKGYVGMKIAKNIVREIFPGSPAEKNGIKIGDTILTVDGKSTYGHDKEEIANMLIGPIGTSVRIVLERQGEQHELMLERTKPGEKLGQALVEESTKKTAADNQNKFVKAQKIDDIDKELLTVFRRTQDTTDIYAQALAALHLIPRHVKQELFDGECKIIITPTLLEAAPELTYQKPRGYLHNADYHHVPGMYRPSARMLLIGERYCHGTRPPEINRMVLSTTLHELGHAYDHSQNYLSQSGDFMQAYDTDLKKLTDSDKTTYHYFVQPEAAGPSELFAELFALSISNKGGITERSASLKTVFPQSFQYVKKWVQ